MGGSGKSSPEKKEELKLPQLVPARPASPFVARLQGEVALSREREQGTSWEFQPSVGSWLTPRSRRREQNARRVSFAEEDAAAQQVRAPTPAQLELKVKGSVCKPFTLENVSARSSVLDLKERCAAQIGLAVEQQRLLHKGKLLQDSQTLEELSLPNKAVLFLVKGASAKRAPDDESHERASAEADRAAEEDELELRALAARYAVGPMCIDCGVNPGRLQTSGLCGICWREQVVKENKELKRRREEAKRRYEEAGRLAEEKRLQEEEWERRRQKDTTRCYKCEKKIGLTGFQCQCGYLFCAKHRHAEDHACSFDHAARGREILAQQVRMAGSSSDAF